MTPSTGLSPGARTHALSAMATDELDVLVVGGGVTGAGAALDAVTRGLRVGLVEARDYASGTSSRSSKLIHGGLRYLEQLNFSLVREALRERVADPQRAGAAPDPPGAVPVPAAAPTVGAVLRRQRRAAVRHDGRWPQGRADPPAPEQAQGAARVQLAAQGCSGRRDPVLRRSGRRRAAHDDDRPHRGARTAPCARPARASSASCARATGSSERWSGTWRPAPTTRCGPSGPSTPPACGPTRSRRWSVVVDSSTSAPPRACTSWSPRTASTPTPASSAAPRRACCSSSPGTRTGSSAPPTPTGTSTWPTRRPAGPTSTT